MFAKCHNSCQEKLSHRSHNAVVDSQTNWVAQQFVHFNNPCGERKVGGDLENLLNIHWIHFPLHTRLRCIAPPEWHKLLKCTTSYSHTSAANTNYCEVNIYKTWTKQKRLQLCLKQCRKRKRRCIFGLFATEPCWHMDAITTAANHDFWFFLPTFCCQQPAPASCLILCTTQSTRFFLHLYKVVLIGNQCCIAVTFPDCSCKV